MPFRDRHVGAPCMWAIRQGVGDAFEVAFTTPEAAEDKAPRKSMEAELIASYRRAEGESPTGAFSRIIPGYRMSSYSRDDERGNRLKTMKQNLTPIQESRRWSGRVTRLRLSQTEWG